MANDAVAQTIRLVEPEQVLRAVELLESAPMVVCIGSGGSMIMAQEFAHMFSIVSSKFRAVSDSHLQMSTTGHHGPRLCRGAVLLLRRHHQRPAGAGAGQKPGHFHHSGYPVPQVSGGHPGGCGAALRSNEGPFQFGSVPARIAQLVVIDVLFQEYYHRNQKSCEENIQSIASALSGMHV